MTRQKLDGISELIAFFLEGDADNVKKLASLFVGMIASSSILRKSEITELVNLISYRVKTEKNDRPAQEGADFILNEATSKVADVLLETWVRMEAHISDTVRDSLSKGELP